MRAASAREGSSHAPRQALAVALAGFALLALGDVVAKAMAGLWPGSAIAALRYVFGAGGLTILVMLRYGRAGFVMPRPWLQFGRGMAVGIATASFFLSLRVMPLADATAIVFTSPVWTLLLSFIFLRERPAAMVMVAVALASIGVLLVLRPNVLAFGAEALLPLAAAVAMASLFMLNRRVAGLAPIFVMQWLVALMALPVLLALTLFGHISGDPAQLVGVPPLAVVAGCAVVAVSATAGHWCIFRATELASAATIAPMTYVQLLVALSAGIILFGDWPTVPMLGGALLIVAGGVLLWHQQRKPPVGPADEGEGL